MILRKKPAITFVNDINQLVLTMEIIVFVKSRTEVQVLFT
jgi:hypothetical protein